MPVVITTLIISILIVLLIKEVFDPLKTFALVVIIFLLLGYISIDDAVAGFSNKGVLAVAVLFVLAGAVEKSSYFQEVTRYSKQSKKKFNPIKMYLTITGLSAFINNTPIVSIFIPIIKSISVKEKISASKFLIPLSYLSMLGGTLTLVGTSTNLVISGLIEEMGLPPLGFFELTKIALPCAFIGFVYIQFFYQKRLPDNRDAFETNRKQTNEHLIRFIVKSNSSIIGKTIKQANMRALSGVYLVEIERQGTSIFPVTPEEIIKDKDLLIFAGKTNQIDELKNIDNLVIETENEICTDYFNHDNTIIMEAVITQHLGNPNQTIKELNFRERFNAVIIGIIRNGDRIQGKLGSIHPKLGDVLLLIAEKSTAGIIEKDPSLTVLNREERKKKEHNIKSIYPFIAFIGTIIFALIFNLNILYTALAGVGFLLITNTIQIKEAIDMIEFKIIILISTSFAVGKALTNTGTAAFVAESLQPLIGNFSPYFLLMVVFIITNLLTNIITNNAAAILSLPIIYEIAALTTYDVRPFLLIAAISASSAFLSPYGYQTNTMVYGAGGYKFKDFITFGYPLTIIVMLVSTTSTYLYYF